jgi:hypothetical protein
MCALRKMGSGSRRRRIEHVTRYAYLPLTLLAQDLGFGIWDLAIGNWQDRARHLGDQGPSY